MAYLFPAQPLVLGLGVQPLWLFGLCLVGSFGASLPAWRSAPDLFSAPARAGGLLSCGGRVPSNPE